MILRPGLLFILAGFCGSVHSATISEAFSSRDLLDSGTAVWNQALGKVHPGLHVVDFKPGFTPLAVDVGDGSHGSFDIATYAQFSVGGDLSGNKIRLDTDAYPILKVTSFHLAQGWVLEPVGSNPLIIYSLSDVTIEGDVWCHGNNGSDAAGALQGLGGSGRCGGAAGGDGGTPGNPGLDGDPADPTVTAGLGGLLNGASAVSGGGGGSWNTSIPPTAGFNSGFGGGDAGASFTDPEFDTIAGGAGGGGGASSTASGGVAGAGGGAGGGTVIIHTVRDFNLGADPSTFGTINVSGGAGGNSNLEGGAGGGGGGGSVLVFAGATINIFNSDGGGASLANNGLGGTNSNLENGGTGGVGRSWFVGNVYNGVGFYYPSEEAPVDPLTAIVEFDPAAQHVISKTIDLSTRLVQISALSTTPASSDFQFEVAGSSDNFVFDDTGFTTDLSLLSAKRYVKFRLTLTAANVNSADMAESVSIDYATGELEEFNLKAAGCGRIENPMPPANALYLFAAFILLGVLKFKAQRDKGIRA